MTDPKTCPRPLRVAPVYSLDRGEGSSAPRRDELMAEVAHIKYDMTMNQPGPPPADAAQMIRELRRRARLTQAELAQRLGTSQPAIARWESGRVDPGYDRVMDVARACERWVIPRVVDYDREVPINIYFNLQMTPAQRLEGLVTFLDFLNKSRRRIEEQDAA